MRAETRRPLPYPDPVGTNDNDEDGPAEPAPRKERRRLSFARLVARVLVAPLYLLVAVGTVAVIGLFALALLNSLAG